MNTSDTQHQINILFLEDRAADVELALRELRRERLQFKAHRVVTEADFRAGLRDPVLDLILADYVLPSYDGLSALALAGKERPDVPFLFVSGRLGEETAIEALHQGAIDYVIKEHLARLGPAVRRALREVEELRRIEQAEARFRTVFEQSPVGITIVDPETARFIDFNEAAHRALGYDRAEFARLGLVDIEAMYAAEEIRRNIERMLREGSADFETRHRTKTGEIRDVQVRTRVIQVAGRTTISSFWHDVTDRKQAEHALSVSEARFRTVFEQSPLGIAIIDPETSRFIDFNETAHRLLGYDRAEFARLGLVDIEAMETPEEVQRHTERMLREGNGDFETHLRTKTGEIRDVQVRTQAIQIEGRAAINAIWRDVTDYKQAEAKLRESEARLNLALTATGMGVWEWQASTGRLYMSDQCYVIAGMTPGEQTLDSVMERVHPDDAPRLLAELQDAVSGRTALETQFRFIRPDGRVRWVSNLGRPEYDEAGKPLRVVGTVQDITDRKVAERAVNESAERLKELTRRLLDVQEAERRHLARELHDEIGQALTAMKVNLIRMERKPAEAADRIAESVEIVDRTLQRVRGMALDLRPSMLDDLGLVAALRWYVKQHAQRTDLASSFTVEPDTLEAEPDIETACFRAAQEALTNVARHAQASMVCVTLREKTGVLELVVRETAWGSTPPRPWRGRRGE